MYSLLHLIIAHVGNHKNPTIRESELMAYLLHSDATYQKTAEAAFEHLLALARSEEDNPAISAGHLGNQFTPKEFPKNKL